MSVLSGLRIFGEGKALMAHQCKQAVNYVFMEFSCR